MGTKILVVDDSDLNLRVTKSQIISAGHECDAVTNANEAYDYILNQKYDIVLMDYLMPGINGIEATKHIRQLHGGFHPDDYYKNLPIIGLTAEDNDAQLKKMLDNGINDILPKPFHPDQLTDIIEKWCSSASPAKAAFKETPAKGAAATRDKIPAIHGIDQKIVDQMYRTDKEGFLELISIFSEDIPAKHERIKEALDTFDIESYTVEVHRIKGEAKMIGANALAEASKRLEFAGKAISGVVPNGKDKEQNLSYILENTSKVMAELDKTNADILALIGEKAPAGASADKDGIVLSEDTLNKIKRYISHANEALDEKDYNLTRDWLNELLEVLNCLN